MGKTPVLHKEHDLSRFAADDVGRFELNYVHFRMNGPQGKPVLEASEGHLLAVVEVEVTEHRDPRDVPDEFLLSKEILNLTAGKVGNKEHAIVSAENGVTTVQRSRSGVRMSENAPYRTFGEPFHKPHLLPAVPSEDPPKPPRYPSETIDKLVKGVPKGSLQVKLNPRLLKMLVDHAVQHTASTHGEGITLIVPDNIYDPVKIEFRTKNDNQACLLLMPMRF